MGSLSERLEAARREAAGKHVAQPGEGATPSIAEQVVSGAGVPEVAAAVPAAPAAAVVAPAPAAPPVLAPAVHDSAPSAPPPGL